MASPSSLISSKYSTLATFLYTLLFIAVKRLICDLSDAFPSIVRNHHCSLPFLVLYKQQGVVPLTNSRSKTCVPTTTGTFKFPLAKFSFIHLRSLSLYFSITSGCSALHKDFRSQLSSHSSNSFVTPSILISYLFSSAVTILLSSTVQFSLFPSFFKCSFIFFTLALYVFSHFSTVMQSLPSSLPR